MDAEANSERNFYSPPNGFHAIFLLHSSRAFQPSLGDSSNQVPIYPGYHEVQLKCTIEIASGKISASLFFSKTGRFSLSGEYPALAPAQYDTRPPIFDPSDLHPIAAERRFEMGST